MTKLAELVESLESLEESDMSVEEVTFSLGESLVVLVPPFLKVKSPLGDIFVGTGLCCELDENNNYEPDWSLTWVWQNKDRPEDYLYYESSGILTSLHNLFPGTSENLNNWEAEFIN